MRPLTIADATSVLGLQQEIQRSEESRSDHRLYGVLLVAQGIRCPEVARLLGDAPRSVEYWVHRFEQSGLSGLIEGERSGRPSQLSQKQASVDSSRRVVAISGNAQYHRSKRHQAWHHQQAPRLGLDFLPPYSPQLNPSSGSGSSRAGCVFTTATLDSSIGWFAR